MNKNILRKQAKEIRNSITEENRKEYNKSIFKFVITNNRFIKADKVLLYSSYNGEISTQELIDYCLENKKPLFLPYTDKNFNISFYLVQNRECLVKSKIGISEPNINLCNQLTKITPDTLCIVPMLAGDFKGQRLGYGKGCYDRFLKDYKGFSMGLVYSACLFETVFSEKTDISLNSFVTENKVIYFDKCHIERN